MPIKRFQLHVILTVLALFVGFACQKKNPQAIEEVPDKEVVDEEVVDTTFRIGVEHANISISPLDSVVIMPYPNETKSKAINVNKDSRNYFEFVCEFIVSSQSGGNQKTVLTFLDTTFYVSTISPGSKMPKRYAKGDTLNFNETWSNVDVILSCSSNNCKTSYWSGSFQEYILFKKVDSNKTRYGWIQLDIEIVTRLRLYETAFEND